MVNLILSNVLNYQAVLDTLFVAFLHGKNISEKTLVNYKSDVKHFIAWILEYYQTNSIIIPETLQDFVKSISHSHIDTYKNMQINSSTPQATTNRRLSSLRIFFTFTQEQGWTTVNPCDSINNVTPPQSTLTTTESLIKNYEQFLKDEGSSQNTIRDYVGDAKQFLTWLSENNGSL